MTKRQFEKLKVNDIVTLNGMCRQNAGLKCKVTHICDDRIWVEPIDGNKLTSVSQWCLPDWNEICYRAANVTNA